MQANASKTYMQDVQNFPFSAQVFMMLEVLNKYKVIYLLEEDLCFL